MKLTISDEDEAGKTRYLYTAAWYGTKGELSDEQAHKLFQTLGWKNTWAKWYQRAWWWLKGVYRRVVRPIE
jgi:hypothetical protein